MSQKVLKILLLEDVDDDVGLIKDILLKANLTFETRAVDTRDDFYLALQSYIPDVILSDHSLRQFNSMEALKIYKDAELEVPFILVTGAVSEEFAAKAITEGADDYVLKSNLSRLPSAIFNALEKRANEKYRRQTELTLRAQNQQLIKINKELDRFVYSVSHNLRSPLTSVLGLINVVRLDNNSGNPSLERYFDLMEESIKKLDDTLRGIIDYSKNSHFEIDIKEIDVSQLINNCFSKLDSLRGFDRVEKIVEVKQETRFCSDEFRLAVVLNNLLSNAIVFRDERKNPFVKISITVKSEITILEIEDNGIGMEERLIPRVFTMFFRATDRSSGSGLGLYLVKETLEKLNGEVEVFSCLDVGTKIIVKIPNLVNRLLDKDKYLSIVNGVNHMG